MSLNQAQQIAVKTYSGGDFAHVTSIEEAREVGDTLFVFLLIELAEKEGCDTLNEAARRLDSAERQLAEVRRAIDEL